MVKLKVDARQGFIFPAGVRTEPLYGYRFWDLIRWRYPDEKEYRWGLGSVTYKGVWTRPILRNKNTPITFQSAWGRDTSYRHKLGYFTWSIDVVDRTVDYGHTYIQVIGRISLFGTVVTHERGFRSQNVKIDELIVIDSKERPRYGWYIKRDTGFIDLATDEPLIVDDSQYPDVDQLTKDLSATYDCDIRVFNLQEKALAYLRYQHKELTDE